MKSGWLTCCCQIEFAGTLLGFDDYVSKYHGHPPLLCHPGLRLIDMVLEDVTELSVFLSEDMAMTD
jgi:hypothetical protein